MRQFSIDRTRLERFRAEAAAARGEKSAATQKTTDLRLDIRAAEDELRQIERGYHRQPERVAAMQKRIDTLRDELAEMTEANAERAAHRDHAVQFAGKLDEYAAAKGISR